MFEDYITVGHAVDRSLSGEQTLCSVILAEQSAVCVGGVIYR